MPRDAEPLAPGVDFATPHAAFLRIALEDALARLLMPSLEREMRNELTDEAETHAVTVFARNLRSLLLQPPLARQARAGDRSRLPHRLQARRPRRVRQPARARRHLSVRRRPGEKKGPREKRHAAPATPSTETPPPATLQQPEPPPPAALQEPESPPLAALQQPETPEQPETLQQPETLEQPEALHQPEPEPSAEAPPAEAPPAEPQVAAEAASRPPAEAAPPPPAPDRRAEAKTRLHELVARHNLGIIALGNGTGCRETEELIADLIATTLPELSYVIVNEAGASVYSVSQVGREEFPSYDATTRSAISIGRRLQDPLSELVKIDPQ